MSQISKCLRVTVVLSYWEASGEVSELSYKSLLFDSSKRSYCSKAITGTDRIYTTGTTLTHVNREILVMWQCMMPPGGQTCN